MKYLWLIPCFVLFLACEKESSSDTNDQDKAVVQGLLWPGDAVEINVSTLVQFSDDGGNGGEGIENIEPILQSDAGTALLMPVDGEAGTYRLESPDLLRAGSAYSISFIYLDSLISAETIIPEKPENFETSDSTVELEYVDESSFTGGMGERPEPTFIEFTWDDPDASDYLISVEFLEDNYSQVNDLFEFDDPEELANFTEGPIQGDAFNLVDRQFYFYGTYRIVLMRISESYAALYETLNQSTLGLTEPPTNVEHGFGYLGAANADTILLEVVKQ